MKRSVLFVLIAVIALGLVVWKILLLPVELGSKPIILGHGGMGVGSMLPLNSLSSLEKALSYPIQGTELDVRMTADEVLIAFHDNNLEHNTNCTGLVSETNLNELKDCLNSTWLRSEPIAKLEKVLSSNWVDGTTFSLDVKTDSEDGSERSIVLVEEISFLIEGYPQFRFLIESQSIWLLNEIKSRNIEAELFYYTHDLDSELNIITDNDFDGISINSELVTAEQVQTAQNFSIKVMLWGSGSLLSNREVLKMNADIIQTDDIRSMVSLLDLK